MSVGYRLCLLGGLVAAGYACSETVERPGPLGDCRGDDCPQVGGGPPPIGVGSGAAGSSGAAGQGGGGGMPPPQAGTLAGTVRSIVEPDLATPGTLDSAVEIRAAGATQGEEVS